MTHFEYSSHRTNSSLWANTLFGLCFQLGACLNGCRSECFVRFWPWVNQEWILLDEFEDVDDDSESDMFSRPRSSSFLFLDVDLDPDLTSRLLLLLLLLMPLLLLEGGGVCAGFIEYGLLLSLIWLDWDDWESGGGSKLTRLIEFKSLPESFNSLLLIVEPISKSSSMQKKKKRIESVKTKWLNQTLICSKDAHRSYGRRFSLLLL